MNHSDFEEILVQQIEECKYTLITKAIEYAQDDDRLHNFKVAAELQGVTPRVALGGMFAKHIVSIFDMLPEDDNSVDMEVWDEKIGDSLNYLFLLKALIVEERYENSPNTIHLTNTQTTHFNNQGIDTNA
jgi:hypothetical protein